MSENDFTDNKKTQNAIKAIRGCQLSASRLILNA